MPQTPDSSTSYPHSKGLLAPYYQCDSIAAGIVIGVSSDTISSHIARAALKACAFQTRVIVDALRADSDVPLTELRVVSGLTNSDFAMRVVSDLGGFDVVWPEMRDWVDSIGRGPSGGQRGRTVWVGSDETETLKRVERGTTRFKRETSGGGEAETVGGVVKGYEAIVWMG